jgi:hypothetical protein
VVEILRENSPRPRGVLKREIYSRRDTAKSKIEIRISQAETSPEKNPSRLEQTQHHEYFPALAALASLRQKIRLSVGLALFEPLATA